MVKELLQLLESENCDYDQCRRLISELGGCTQIIRDRFGLQTTPLYQAIEYGHYDFALALIAESDADFDVAWDLGGPILWELQYLDVEASEAEQWEESEGKLRLMRALIHAGANPNPVCDGEELLYYIRFKLSEGEETYTSKIHLWQMEHIIDAHVNRDTPRFSKKLREQGVSRIMIPAGDCWLIDDDLCDCDHAVFVFEDGERMALSSYQVGDDEWDFYAVPIDKDLMLAPEKYRDVVPNEGLIRLIQYFDDEEFPTSHWLDLSIDDAILRIHADEPSLMVGIVGRDFEDYEQMKRKNLF